MSDQNPNPAANPAAATLAAIQQRVAAAAGQAQVQAPAAPTPAPTPSPSSAPVRTLGLPAEFASDAPPARAQEAYLRLPGFDTSDSYAVTLVATKYHPAYVFEFPGKPAETKPAVEMIFGALLPTGKPAFFKTFPLYYSIGENAKYAKYFAAFAGQFPGPGTTPRAILGASALATISAEVCTSPRGTTYVKNKLTALTPLPSVMRSLATPREVLLPHLLAAIEASKSAPKAAAAQPKANPAAPQVPDDDIPF